MASNLIEKFSGELNQPVSPKGIKQRAFKILRRRRAIIGLSLFGIGVLAAASFFQTSNVKHLSDAAADEGIDPEHGNLSDSLPILCTRYGLFSLISFAANIPAAVFGSKNRAHDHPVLPIYVASKCGIEALVARRHFYQMPSKEKKWGDYCVLAVFAGIAALSIPEAKEAYKSLMGK